MMVGGWFVDDAKTFAANNAIEAVMAGLPTTVPLRLYSSRNTSLSNTTTTTVAKHFPTVTAPVKESSTKTAPTGKPRKDGFRTRNAVH